MSIWVLADAIRTDSILVHTRDKSRLRDLRDSGTIEQVADCVAFIYRPERYGFTRDEKTGHSLVGVGKIYIAKNRNGSTGIARFRYNPSFTRITDYIQPGTQTSLGL